MTKNVALLTSGGDAPGMNAAIAAVCQQAHRLGWHVLGFFHGYNGLLDDEHCQLQDNQVRHIIHQGGTLLKSARCQRFVSPEGACQAAAVLTRHQVDALIVIGGDGSFRGLKHLSHYWQGQLIGIPATIDNDIAGCDYTIGCHTAVTTAMEAIDKIRDTADALERLFLVEVMGNGSPWIAETVARATAAEQVLAHPPTDTTTALATICTHIRQCHQQYPHHSYIMVIAEHYWPQGSQQLARQIEQATGLDCRCCVLGHIQRGGSPAYADRILATRLGEAAVTAVANDKHLVMTALQGKQINWIAL